MGGEVGRDIAQIGLGFSDRIAEVSVDRLFQKKAKEQDTTRALATQLAAQGQLSNLPPEVQKTFQKTLGNDLFEALSFRSGLQGTLANISQGAEDVVNAPVSEQVTTQQPLFPGQGAEPTGSPAELLQQGLGPADPAQQSVTQPVTQVQERAPTPTEQFQRFQELGPVGSALIGGNELGALALGQLRSKTSLFASNAQTRRQLNEFVIKQADQGRRVLAPVPASQFNEDQLQDGFFPVTVEGQVYQVQTKNPQFRFGAEFSAEALAQGVTNPRDVTPKASRSIINAITKREIAVKAAEGLGAARIREEAWQGRPVGMNFKDHGYFDTVTGERIPGAVTQNEANEAERSGRLKFLNNAERSNLLQSKKAANQLTQLNELVAAVYEKGGIFENLTASGRIQAGVKGALARAFQTDTDLTVVTRQIEGFANNIARELGGQRGAQTERDATRAEALLARLRGFPDSKEVAFSVMNELRTLLQDQGRTILGSKTFEHEGLLPINQVRGKLSTQEEVQSNTPIQLDGPQAEAIAIQFGLSPAQAREVRDTLSNQPVSAAVFERALRGFMQQQQGQQGTPLPSNAALTQATGQVQ